jgi:hypothetical protein
MSIDSINNNNNSGIYGINNNLKNKYKNTSSENTSAASVKADKFELSEQAQKMQQIKARVEDGFYNNPDILKEVALKLNKEFPKQ